MYNNYSVRIYAPSLTFWKTENVCCSTSLQFSTLIDCNETHVSTYMQLQGHFNQ